MANNAKNAVVAFLAAVMLTGCGKNIPETPSGISVSSGGKEISVVAEQLFLDNENGSDNEYFSAESWIEQIGEPEYYPVGSVFEIKFPEDVGIPDNISINDVVITSDGKMKYDKRSAVNEDVPVINDDTVQFVLDRHLATALSSNSDDYKKGSSYRSFGINCEWEEDEVCRYTFCVRSDPDFIMEE